MAGKEGRLSRWSRLKQKGGASQTEETTIDVERERAPNSGHDAGGTGAGESVMSAPDPASLPGGDFRYNDIPLMAPLAGVEDGDTEFEAAPAEALALLTGDLAHDSAPAVSQVDGSSEPVDEVERDLTEEEAEVVAGLPAIDSLTSKSDFTPFLTDKVPEFIRRRALSVLWRSDPVLANIDGLNDYDEDFNIIDTLIDIAKDTNYKVGKGMVDDDEDDEDDEKDAQAAEQAPADVAARDENVEIEEHDAEALENEAAPSVTETGIHDGKNKVET